MRTVWDEARRLFRMTLEDMGSMGLGRRSGMGWWADRHLRKGYLAGLPLFLVAGFFMLRGFDGNHPFSAFFRILLPAAILCNLVWFAVAAWSRAKSRG